MNANQGVLGLVLVAWLWGGGVRVCAEEERCVVVGYLPEYRLAGVTAEALRGVTDLIYFGLEPAVDGRLAEPPIVAKALEKLQGIQREVGCRLLISVGGWNRSAHFPELCKEDEGRKRFVEEMATYCKSNGFSGIDYDWEHPKDEGELRLYRTLIADTRERFRRDDLQVTVAQASWQDLGKAVYDLVDRVHLMSYDHEFPQATMGKSLADVERLRGWGCPAGKIALGIPFYGRNAKREARSYGDLVTEADFDPTKDEVNGFAYNGRTTIAAKTDHVLKQGLAGIMIWEVGQDAGRGGESLLRSIVARVEAADAPRNESE